MCVCAALRQGTCFSCSLQGKPLASFSVRVVTRVTETLRVLPFSFSSFVVLVVGDAILDWVQKVALCSIAFPKSIRVNLISFSLRSFLRFGMDFRYDFVSNEFDLRRTINQSVSLFYFF